MEELVKKAQSGDRQARDQIVDKCKDLVSYLAKNLYINGGETDDLIQEGMIGLLDAIDDYDPKSGAEFTTFAHLCIQRRMTNAISASNRKKHEPLNSFVSISAGSAEDGENPQVDPEDPINTNPENIVVGEKSAAEDMDALMASLSKREKEVLRLMLSGYDYRQIAEALGITAKSADNTIQRIRKKAKDRLKSE